MNIHSFSALQPAQVFHIESYSFADEERNIQLGQVTQQWQNFAQERLDQETLPQMKNILEDSVEINRLMSFSLKFTLVVPHEKATMYICKDRATEELQALAFTRSSSLPFLKLTHLATNPKNIPSALSGSSSNRIKGAGTALIEHIAQQALKEGHAGIWLESFPSAIPFYEKVGFEKLPDMTEIGLPSNLREMQLTARKIQDMLTQKKLMAARATIS